MATWNKGKESEKREPGGTGLPAALLLAFIPIAGYLTVYLYNLGRAFAFHIPSSLIVIDITSVCIAVSAVVVVMALFIAISE